MLRRIAARLDTAQMRRWLALNPAAPLAAALMLGISAGVAWGVPWAWGLSLALGALLAAFWVRRARPPLLALTALLAGAALGHRAWHVVPDDDIRRHLGDEPLRVEAELQLLDTPRMIRRVGGTPPAYAATARVLAIGQDGRWQPASGRVTCLIQRPAMLPAEGQRWRGPVTLQPIEPPQFPGQIDFRSHYRLRGIHVQGRFGDPWRFSVTPARASPVRWLRARVGDVVDAGFSPDRDLERALLGALLLGDSEHALRDLRRQFVRTGTLHHLVVSGMHVAILAGFTLLIVRAAGLSGRWAILAAAVFLLLYAAVVAPATPVLRAVIMGFTWVAGRMLYRTSGAVQSLALAALIVLAINPLDLFTAGFALSFGAVLGLILFSDPVARMMHRPDIDQQVLDSFLPPSAWRKAWAALGRTLRRALAAALVAWIVTMPLLAWHFERFNPYAPLAGLLLAVPVMFALVLGLVKLLAGGLWPSLSPLLADVAGWPLRLMQWMLDVLDRLPGADLPTTVPSAWMLVLVYALILAPLIPLKPAILAAPAAPLPAPPTTGRRHKLCWLAGAIVALVLPFWSDFSTRQPTGPAVVLSMRQHGVMALIQTQHGWFVLGELDDRVDDYRRYAGNVPMLGSLPWDATAAPDLPGVHLQPLSDDQGRTLGWTLVASGSERRILLAPHWPADDLWRLSDHPADVIVLRSSRVPPLAREVLRPGGHLVLASRSPRVEQGGDVTALPPRRALVIGLDRPGHPMPLQPGSGDLSDFPQAAPP